MSARDTFPDIGASWTVGTASLGVGLLPVCEGNLAIT